ncbi:MAG TPA: hypothetical protein VNV43_07355 [Candidatus Acidoferrales bacterium]|nr:hypothetical protein [Candidatus Acidoferrales bacterium]
MKIHHLLFSRAAAGLLAGAAIAAVDNFAFHGEISPIVIVALLLLAAAAIGLKWGARAVAVAIIVWAWVPMAHVIKKMFGLPDTLHPNTYASIFALAVFSLVITAIGFGLGIASRCLLVRSSKG